MPGILYCVPPAKSAVEVKFIVVGVLGKLSMNKVMVVKGVHFIPCMLSIAPAPPGRVALTLVARNDALLIVAVISPQESLNAYVGALEKVELPPEEFVIDVIVTSVSPEAERTGVEKVPVVPFIVKVAVRPDKLLAPLRLK